MTDSDVISDVRGELRDDETPYRWSDSEIRRFVSDGQIEIAGRRPDSLYGSSIVTTAPDPITDADAGEDLAIQDSFRYALVAYCCGRALQQDKEHASNATAANQYFLQFAGLLT